MGDSNNGIIKSSFWYLKLLYLLHFGTVAQCLYWSATTNKSVHNESMQYLCCDMKNIMTSELGFVQVDWNDNNYLCHDLTSWGKHFNDYPKQYIQYMRKDQNNFPQSILLQNVIDSLMTRPKLDNNLEWSHCFKIYYNYNYSFIHT